MSTRTHRFLLEIREETLFRAKRGWHSSLCDGHPGYDTGRLGTGRESLIFKVNCLSYQESNDWQRARKA